MAPGLPNMIIVEGGPTAIKKYKKLLLRRVRWNEKAKPREGTDGEENKE
jgi:U4/U6 small nuclear ribonucleoprotein PRP3